MLLGLLTEMFLFHGHGLLLLLLLLYSHITIFGSCECKCHVDDSEMMDFGHHNDFEILKNLHYSGGLNHFLNSLTAPQFHFLGHVTF
jgi:hypothetical protein